MDENFTANEADQIRSLLAILARRGYVRISELTAILRGCRECSYTLDDLMVLLLEIVGTKIEVIDDRVVSFPTEVSSEAEEEPKETVLRDDLEFSPESVVATLGKMRLKKEDASSREHDGVENMDALIIQTQSVANELILRKRFGILQIEQEEYEAYLREIILFAMLNDEYARCLLDEYLRAIGISSGERTVDFDRLNTEKQELHQYALPEEKTAGALEIMNREDRQNGRR